jgi:transcriptional regulator with XRE-family HTH domain
MLNSKEAIKKMNFSKQLKMYRERDGFSQEELAGKIYVTRQTISKWENDHSYPDIHNLIALSTLFDVTLDELIKGDVEKMKASIDVEKMNKYTWIMIIFLVLTVITIIPLVDLWNWYGMIIPFTFWAIAMIAALKIEKIKKEKNVQTYAEIIAFIEGGDIEAARKLRNKKQDSWHKLAIALAVSLLGGLVTVIVGFLWFWFT